MKTFYVYELVDPRDGHPFYIGKGCGGRMYQHVAAARAGRKDCNPGKSKRILEIEAAGLFVIERKVAEFDCGVAALDYERTLVASTDGLTNILAGGGGWAGLSKAELARRDAQRDQARKQKRMEKSKAWLRDWLAMAEKWPHGATAYGVADGNRFGAEFMHAVRGLLAEPA